MGLFDHLKSKRYKSKEDKDNAKKSRNAPENSKNVIMNSVSSSSSKSNKDVEVDEHLISDLSKYI
jgi:hypothetical protein